ncbi:MAG TPA: hypothetical protein VNI78_09025 [Vicinamibacterales bacterium]|nr:hypothetical protein [Vicinamibacterales bacterium]
MSRPSFHGLFELLNGAPGPLMPAASSSALLAIPDPQTGRPLKIASVEISDRAVCPACTQLGAGAYISFVSDLRLVFACRSCRELVWIAGA